MALGAAVGEAVLGRKLGNKAMFWGAVAGTIPDLDVLANPFISDAESVKFHRGPTHSLFSSLLFSGISAYVLNKYYNSKLHQSRRWRKAWAFIYAGLPLLLALLLIYYFSGNLGIVGSGVMLSLLFLLSWSAWKRSPLDNRDFTQPKISQWFLFFLGIYTTHIVLDAFTTYGTQLFWPISDYPVALDNISIVDPLYTFPLLGFILAASFNRRTSKIRRTLTVLSLTISSLYLGFTMINKQRVDRVLTHTLERESIEWVNYKVTPTLFNNALWYGIIETEDQLIKSYYSVFDEEKQFEIRSESLKNHQLIDAYKEQHEIQILAWFSRGYHIIEETPDGYHWYDLRFGNIDFTGKNSSRESPFRFLLETVEEKDKLEVKRSRPEFEGDLGEVWSSFWDRIRGIKSD